MVALKSSFLTCLLGLSLTSVLSTALSQPSNMDSLLVYTAGNIELRREEAPGPKWIAQNGNRFALMKGLDPKSEERKHHRNDKAGRYMNLFQRKLTGSLKGLNEKRHLQPRTSTYVYYPDWQKERFYRPLYSPFKAPATSSPYFQSFPFQRKKRCIVYAVLLLPGVQGRLTYKLLPNAPSPYPLRQTENTYNNCYHHIPYIFWLRTPQESHHHTNDYEAKEKFGNLVTKENKEEKEEEQMKHETLEHTTKKSLQTKTSNEEDVMSATDIEFSSTLSSLNIDEPSNLQAATESAANDYGANTHVDYEEAYELAESTTPGVVFSE